MGHRGNLAAEVRSEGRVEFAFLVEEADFSGPYETANGGLLFRRDRLMLGDEGELLLARCRG